MRRCVICTGRAVSPPLSSLGRGAPPRPKERRLLTSGEPADAHAREDEGRVECEVS